VTLSRSNAAAADDPDPFATIRRYRLAGREIARNEDLGDGRYLALVRLVDRARATLDGWLAAECQAVIHAEAVELLDHGRTPAAPAPTYRDPVVDALRALRRAGYSRCESCHRGIPTLDELTRLEDAGRAAWAELVARELAPAVEAAAAVRSQG
jgi:hypothetical protein